MSDHSKALKEWQEKNLTERVEALEGHKARLEKEISQLRKPDCNRMVAEKLRTTTSGCNCQRMLLILVQDGQVMAQEALTPVPCHLREAKTAGDNREWHEHDVLNKVGDAFYRPEGNNHWRLDFEPNLAGIKRHDNLIPTIQINGKHYYTDPCSFADEAVSEALDSYSCPDEIKYLPNGIYHILFEQACYSYTTMEGTEGETDSDFKVYDSVPLWDFFKNKDWMIGEANPESEELADTYLYIQQTKQNRRKYR